MILEVKKELKEKLDEEKIKHLNNMSNILLKLKINAVNFRTTARDIYDIAFILKNYHNEIYNIDKDLLQKSYDIFCSDITGLLLDYEELFKNDKILDMEDLFLTAQRLESFRKVFEKEYKKPFIQKIIKPVRKVKFKR